MEIRFKKAVVEKPKFILEDRHIRWNCEKSPESEATRKKVRYHFVVVDDRFREEKIEKIISNFQEKSIANYPFEEIRRVEEKFVGTKFRYLFVSYDTEYTSKYLSFRGVSENVKKDSDLRERKTGTIEDYVASIYSKD